MTDLLTRLQEALGDAYRVERELARGGMSQLFLATELSLNRPVVVKILPPEEASAVSARRFRQEIEVAANLQHPHILPVLSTGNQDDLIWFVMPYVRGESLRQRIDQDGALPPDDAVGILVEVADALAFAHDHGIIHRDIKPENILLHEGHAVLTDFGVARARERAARANETRLTGFGMAIGTPGYMSPEQAAGEANIDARADIYALAVVGYEMLTGQPPFTGASAQAVMAAHLTATPKPLTAFRKDVPPQVVAALNTALAKQPARRFQTATAFREALKGSLRLRTGPSRRVVAIGAGIVLPLAVALGVLWPRGYRAEGDPRRSLVVFPFENRTGDPTRDYLEEAAMNLLGLSVAHWQDMRVYDDERTASALRRRDIEGPEALDFTVAQEVAREGRVGTLVLGDIRREGDSLAIEAKVHDVRTGDRIATHVVRGAWGADPRPLFDQLASLVLGTSGAPPGERPSVIAQTTSSVAAYRAYLAGVDALQRFDLDSARAALNRAIALDSTFALAYVRLRDAEGWNIRGSGTIGAPERRAELIRMAQRYTEHLPPRLRNLVAFHAAYEQGDFRRARAIAERMIARDSTDVEFWYQLGEAHFHHTAFTFPPPDTVGNIGKALRAFQRALALDSNYILAYQHIMDALRACGGINNGVLCLADSAIYGSDSALAAQVGRATVERLSAEAREAQIRTGRAWITVAPSTARARSALVAALVQQERWGEARNEIETMRTATEGPDAAYWSAIVAFGQGDYGRAAAEFEAALASADTTYLVQLAIQRFGPETLPVMLAGGGGRVETGAAIARAFMNRLPLDSLPGPGGLGWARDDITALIVGVARMQAGVGSGGGTIATLLARFDDRTREERLRVYGTLSSGFIGAYLASRDTLVLTRFLANADSSWASWRVATAQRLLARGDSAGARRLATDVPAAHLEDTGGLLRAFAWADLLAQLGDARGALAMYQRFDGDEDADPLPGYVVRSWRERGALYQQLNRPDSAIAMYRRFAEAWDGADDVLQPLVQRARDAIRALEGQTQRVRG